MCVHFTWNAARKCCASVGNTYIILLGPSACGFGWLVVTLLHCRCSQAKESIAADQPPEVRILKHLLTVSGESEMREALDDAFTPGTAEQTADSDFLSTCALSRSVLDE